MIHVAVTVGHVTIQTGTDAPWSPDVWEQMLASVTTAATAAMQSTEPDWTNE